MVSVVVSVMMVGMVVQVAGPALLGTRGGGQGREVGCGCVCVGGGEMHHTKP